METIIKTCKKHGSLTANKAYVSNGYYCCKKCKSDYYVKHLEKFRQYSRLAYKNKIKNQRELNQYASD